MSEITREDLVDLRESLITHVDRRCDAIEVRLSAINGRVRENETSLARHGVRLEHLELVIDAPRRRHSDVVLPPPPPPVDPESKPVTRRDVAIAVAAMTAVIAGASKVLQWFLQTIKGL